MSVKTTGSMFAHAVSTKLQLASRTDVLCAARSEPATSFAKDCSCLLVALTLRMPSRYCASADASLSVSFWASTVKPSMLSVKRSLLL